eukprot:1192880-Prorocentrum_minimum.AAC.3
MAMSGLARVATVSEVSRAPARATSNGQGALLPRAASAVCGRHGKAAFAPKARNERKYAKTIRAVADELPPIGSSGEYDDVVVLTDEDERISRALKLGQDCASSTKVWNVALLHGSCDPRR